MGAQRVIRGMVGWAPPGIFIENGLNEERCERLREMQQRGFSVFNICEESTAYLHPSSYCDEHLNRSSMVMCDHSFVISKPTLGWTEQRGDNFLETRGSVGKSDRAEEASTFLAEEATRRP